MDLTIFVAFPPYGFTIFVTAAKHGESLYVVAFFYKIHF